MNRQYAQRALDGVNKLLTPAVDTNSEAESELQAIRDDLEMALEDEPEPVEEYEPDLEPALEGEEAEEDEDGDTSPEGLMSSYTGA